MNQNYQERPEVLPINLDTFAKNLQEKERAVYISENGVYSVYMHPKTGRALSLAELNRTSNYYVVSFPKMKLPISPVEFEKGIFQCIFREFLGYSRYRYAIPTRLSVQEQIRMCCVLIEAMHDVQITAEQAKAVHQLCIDRFNLLNLKVFDQIYNGCTLAIDQWHAEREVLSIALDKMIVD